jgi:hypothetical protein
MSAGKVTPEDLLPAIDDVFGPRVTVIYDSEFFRLPNLGIAQQGSFAGWLMVRHPDGQWVSLADLKPHFPPPPPTDESKVSAEYAVRVAKLERDYDALSYQRDELREALRVGREVLAAVIGDIEDGFGFGDIRAKYIQTLLNARDGMDLALTNSRGGQ